MRNPNESNFNSVLKRGYGGSSSFEFRVWMLVRDAKTRNLTEEADVADGGGEDSTATSSAADGNSGPKSGYARPARQHET